MIRSKQRIMGPKHSTHLHLAVLAKQLTQIVSGGCPRQVANVHCKNSKTDISRRVLLAASTPAPPGGRL